MNTMTQIKNQIPNGTELRTPSERASFTIEFITLQMAVILVGKQRKTVIEIPSECFETVIQALPHDSWMLIGATHGTPDPDTLDYFVQKFTNGVSAASYVAPILVEAKLAKIDPKKPARIQRLIA